MDTMKAAGGALMASTGIGGVLTVGAALKGAFNSGMAEWFTDAGRTRKAERAVAVLESAEYLEELSNGEVEVLLEFAIARIAAAHRTTGNARLLETHARNSAERSGQMYSALDKVIRANLNAKLPKVNDKTKQVTSFGQCDIHWQAAIIQSFTDGGVDPNTPLTKSIGSVLCALLGSSPTVDACLMMCGTPSFEHDKFFRGAPSAQNVFLGKLEAAAGAFTDNGPNGYSVVSTGTVSNVHTQPLTICGGHMINTTTGTAHRITHVVAVRSRHQPTRGLTNDSFITETRNLLAPNRSGADKPIAGIKFCFMPNGETWGHKGQPFLNKRGIFVDTSSSVATSFLPTLLFDGASTGDWPVSTTPAPLPDDDGHEPDKDDAADKLLMSSTMKDAIMGSTRFSDALTSQVPYSKVQSEFRTGGNIAAINIYETGDGPVTRHEFTDAFLLLHPDHATRRYLAVVVTTASQPSDSEQEFERISALADNELDKMQRQETYHGDAKIITSVHTYLAGKATADIALSLPDNSRVQVRNLIRCILHPQAAPFQNALKRATTKITAWRTTQPRWIALPVAATGDARVGVFLDPFGTTDNKIILRRAFGGGHTLRSLRRPESNDAVNPTYAQVLPQGTQMLKYITPDDYTIRDVEDAVDVIDSRDDATTGDRRFRTEPFQVTSRSLSVWAKQFPSGSFAIVHQCPVVEIANDKAIPKDIKTIAATCRKTVFAAIEHTAYPELMFKPGQKKTKTNLNQITQKCVEAVFDGKLLPWVTKHSIVGTRGGGWGLDTGFIKHVREQQNTLRSLRMPEFRSNPRLQSGIGSGTARTKLWVSGYRSTLCPQDIPLELPTDGPGTVVVRQDPETGGSMFTYQSRVPMKEWLDGKWLQITDIVSSRHDDLDANIGDAARESLQNRSFRITAVNETTTGKTRLEYTISIHLGGLDTRPESLLPRSWQLQASVGTSAYKTWVAKGTAQENKRGVGKSGERNAKFYDNDMKKRATAFNTYWKKQIGKNMAGGSRNTQTNDVTTIADWITFSLNNIKVFEKQGIPINPETFFAGRGWVDWHRWFELCDLAYTPLRVEGVFPILTKFNVVTPGRCGIENVFNLWSAISGGGADTGPVAQQTFVDWVNTAVLGTNTSDAQLGMDNTETSREVVSCVKHLYTGETGAIAVRNRVGSLMPWAFSQALGRAAYAVVPVINWPTDKIVALLEQLAQRVDVENSDTQHVDAWLLASTPVTLNDNTTTHGVLSKERESVDVGPCIGNTYISSISLFKTGKVTSPTVHKLSKLKMHHYIQNAIKWASTMSPKTSGDPLAAGLCTFANNSGNAHNREERCNEVYTYITHAAKTKTLSVAEWWKEGVSSECREAVDANIGWTPCPYAAGVRWKQNPLGSMDPDLNYALLWRIATDPQKWKQRVAESQSSVREGIPSEQEQDDINTLTYTWRDAVFMDDDGNVYHSGRQVSLTESLTARISTTTRVCANTAAEYVRHQTMCNSTPPAATTTAEREFIDCLISRILYMLTGDGWYNDPYMLAQYKVLIGNFPGDITVTTLKAERTQQELEKKWVLRSGRGKKGHWNPRKHQMTDTQLGDMIATFSNVSAEKCATGARCGDQRGVRYRNALSNRVAYVPLPEPDKSAVQCDPSVFAAMQHGICKMVFKSGDGDGGAVASVMKHATNKQITALIKQFMLAPQSMVVAQKDFVYNPPSNAILQYAEKMCEVRDVAQSLERFINGMLMYFTRDTDQGTVSQKDLEDISPAVTSSDSWFDAGLDMLSIYISIEDRRKNANASAIVDKRLNRAEAELGGAKTDITMALSYMAAQAAVRAATDKRLWQEVSIKRGHKRTLDAIAGVSATQVIDSDRFAFVMRQSTT